VHDEVEIVDQHPLRTLLPFDVSGLGALLGERVDNSVCDGADLPRVVADRSRSSR
jgi:hypothetical protein